MPLGWSTTSTCVPGDQVSIDQEKNTSLRLPKLNQRNRKIEAIEPKKQTFEKRQVRPVIWQSLRIAGSG
jgi:hypothetical protein